MQCVIASVSNFRNRFHFHYPPWTPWIFNKQHECCLTTVKIFAFKLNRRFRIRCVQLSDYSVVCFDHVAGWASGAHTYLRMHTYTRPDERCRLHERRVHVWTFEHFALVDRSLSIAIVCRRLNQIATQLNRTNSGTCNSRLLRSFISLLIES